MASASTNALVDSIAASGAGGDEELGVRILSRMHPDKASCYIDPVSWEEMNPLAKSTFTLHRTRRLHHVFTLDSLFEHFVEVIFDPTKKEQSCIFTSDRIRLLPGKKKSEVYKFVPMIRETTLGFRCPCVINPKDANPKQCDKFFPIDFLIKRLDSSRADIVKKKAYTILLRHFDCLGKVIRCSNPKCSCAMGWVPEDIVFMPCYPVCPGKVGDDLCEKPFCLHCKEPSHHKGLTCKDYKEYCRMKTEGRKLSDFQKELLRDHVLCPCIRTDGSRCGMAIKKIVGCDHMICTTCHGHFCWKCNKQTSDNPYGKHMVAHGGLYICKDFLKDDGTGHLELRSEEEIRTMNAAIRHQMELFLLIRDGEAD